MALLDDVKAALRVDGDANDSEIQDLIQAARADLALAGVNREKVHDDEDPLIKRAIIMYCHAHFNWDSVEGERIQRSYLLLKGHLTLAGDYRAGDVGD